MDTITLPQSLLTVNDLLALGGLVVAVYVIMSFLKDPLKMFAKWITKKDDGDWIVRPATVLVALGILSWLMLVQGVVNSETIGLAVINSFLVALIAGATHDYIVAPTKAKSSNQLTFSTLDYEPIIYKAQIDEVSPPIITPQPQLDKDGYPVEQTL